MGRNEIAELIVQKLEAERKSIQDQWANPVGTSTRHFVIDSFMPESLTHKIYEAFPRNAEGFHDQESFREKKRSAADLSKFDPVLSDITYAVQSPIVVDKVAEIIGFKEIEPDPTLYAGGISMMFKDNFLNPHIDNSHDAKRDRYRRLNLLFYVTPDWKLENGGNFELWDDEQEVPKTIVSKFNRLVVMETDKRSWHSVSRVVIDRARCCVSNYFFSKKSPDETDYYHVTSFSGRPGEKLKRAVAGLDNGVRNFIHRALMVGSTKGKDD